MRMPAWSTGQQMQRSGAYCRTLVPNSRLMATAHPKTDGLCASDNTPRHNPGACRKAAFHPLQPRGAKFAKGGVEPVISGAVWLPTLCLLFVSGVAIVSVNGVCCRKQWAEGFRQNRVRLPYARCGPIVVSPAKWKSATRAYPHSRIERIGTQAAVKALLATTIFWRWKNATQTPTRAKLGGSDRPRKAV